jgi:hypothetical protein
LQLIKNLVGNWLIQIWRQHIFFEISSLSLLSNQGDLFWGMIPEDYVKDLFPFVVFDFYIACFIFNMIFQLWFKFIECWNISLEIWYWIGYWMVTYCNWLNQIWKQHFVFLTFPVYLYCLTVEVNSARDVSQSSC